jgi:hypothetical protein
MNELEGSTMTTTNRHPGKFEACEDQDLGEALYQLVNDGGCDDELGDVQDFGWYGLVLPDDAGNAGYILFEDNNGFFEYQGPYTALEVNDLWRDLQAQYQEFIDGSEY